MARTLAALTVRAWRLTLDVPSDVCVTVSMLRGVWGAALKGLSESYYQSLFRGGASETPRYLLRPAPRRSDGSLAFDFLRFDGAVSSADTIVWDAWSRAERMGLGPRREPFVLQAVVPLAWDGTELRPGRIQPGFALDPLPWPLGDVACPCVLEFPAPLRLIHQGRLIARPLLPDLALAAVRRVYGLLGSVAEPLWARRAHWLATARAVASGPWLGRPLDLVRYSGTQEREVEIRGVAGRLDLPEGPGLLAPLLTAATWFHLGKSTVLGLGQLRILRPSLTSSVPMVSCSVPFAQVRLRASAFSESAE
jgi:hypothetical protein